VNQPNVLLIIADQWRGDCLGYEGHPDVKTPRLDQLCAEGFSFPHAYSATPTCIPARAALYTGMAQENHCRVGYQDGNRWDYEHTLASTFADAGYQCHCAGKLHVHPLRNSVGYHSVDLHDGYLHYYRKPGISFWDHQNTADDYLYWLRTRRGAQADIIDTGIDCNSWVVRPWPYDECEHPTRWVTDRALDFLRRRDRDKPFFLTVSYVRPHPPLDAPEAFLSMYRGRDLTPPVYGDWDDPDAIGIGGYAVDADTGPLDCDQRTEAQRGYYAAMTQIDYEIGRLRDTMFEHGLSDNTIILFVSDHGELLCDHHLFRKSLPFEGSARVPLIVRAPGDCLARAGYTGQSRADKTAVTAHVAELRDVMPTLLALAGVDIPDTVDGVNLFSDAPAERELIHGEHLAAGGSVQFMVSDHDKYVWYSSDGHELYFDLAKDPGETHNAIADAEYTERVAYLRGALIEALAWREEGFVENGVLVAGRPCRPVLEHTLRDRET